MHSKVGDEDAGAEREKEKNEKGSSRNAKESAHSAVTHVVEDDEKSIQQSTTVFIFWAYVAAFVTLLTLSMLLISSIIPPDEETEFFSMPPDVRQHFLKGKLLKIEVGKDRFPLKVFVREEGALTTSETVFLCHGLGASSFAYRSLISNLASRGLHVIALDFPGAGLSDKPAGNQGGLILKLGEIFKEIREKGLLWRFEQMFETGAFPDPTPTFGVDVHYDAGDLSESIDQVVSLLAPSPVHVVLHDTSVEAGLTWAIRKPTLVRSITLIDAYPGTPSFPAGLLGFPGLGFLILRSSVLLQALLRLCCVTHVTHVEANSHAFLLRIYGGRGAALQAWQKANSSFDLISSIEKLSELPVHLLWSNSSGTHWQELGDSLASRLPLASYASHNGGRWPQIFAPSWITNTFEVDVMTAWNQLSVVNCESLEENNAKFWDALLPVSSFKMVPLAEQIEKYCFGLPKGIKKYCTKTSLMNMSQLMENAELVDDLIQGKPDEDGFKTRRKRTPGKTVFSQGQCHFQAYGNRPNAENQQVRPPSFSGQRQGFKRHFTGKTIEERKALRDAKKCYICEEEHFANECPQRNSQNKDDKSDRKGKKPKPKPSARLVPDLVQQASPFVPARKKIKSEHMIKLFMHIIFKYHGMPQSIVSERDPRMTSLFWKALFENMGTTLKFSSSFHPQTDGQSEEANSTVLDLLKCYVSKHMATWEHYLPLVEYAYNNTVHTLTGKAPFERVEGGKKVPPILQTKDKIFEADKYVQNTDEAYRKIKLAFEKTQSKQKKAADRHRRELVFSLGDWVLLRFEKARLRKMKGKERLFPKLGMRYYGPFQVMQNSRFLAFLQPPPPTQQFGSQVQIPEPVGAQTQEDKAPELTEDLYGFITSLPPTFPSSAVDSIPRNTEEMLTAKRDDAVNYGHSGHICDHGHNHDHGHLHEGYHVDHIHDHGLGYMEHMPHGGWVI
ncbi:hypothetical protein L7F22_061782 [Adiantum nelumboides]|nr:hypothetical protein [Adiantum nelumboides]